MSNKSHEAEKDLDGTQWYYWSVETSTEPTSLIDNIEKVTYHLHPTFTKTKHDIVKKPFILTSKGWGEFIIKVDIKFKKGRKKLTVNHHLLLGPQGNVTRSILD